MLNIDELIKDSLKNKKTVELKVYRNLKAEIMAFKTQKNAPVYDEASEIKIIQKYMKKMEDAEKQYSQAGRDDLALECKDEQVVLGKLLPEPVNESDIYDWVVSQAISKGWVGKDDVSERVMIPKKEMGNTVKLTKTQFPSADGKMIANIVKKLLE